MTSKERILTALERGVPDRVPVTSELVGRFAHAVMGRADWRAQCDVHRLIGSDIFNLQGVGPHFRIRWDGGYNDETHLLEQGDDWSIYERVLTTPKGNLTSKVKQGGLPGDPLCPKTIEYLVKRREDYEIYALYAAEWARRAEVDNAVSVEALDYVGDDGVTNFWFNDSFYFLAHARNSQDFILDLLDAPDLIEEALKSVHRRTERCLEAFNESAAEALIFDVCWASTSMVNPAMTRRFVLPEIQWAMANVKPGKKKGLFLSGRMRDILPMLVETGADFIETLDALGDCDLAEVKRTFGDRVCLMGNFNCVVLAHGTVEDARRETLRCLDAAMAGGGYILSTSDEVPADAKLENMKAMAQIVGQHGRYSRQVTWV